MTVINLSAGRKHTIKVGDKVHEVTLRPGEVRYLPFVREVLDIPKIEHISLPQKTPTPTSLPQKTINIRREDIGHKGTIYKAETDLGARVSQFKYEVWQTIGRLTEQIEVKGKETTRYGVISFTIPYSAQVPTMDRRIAIKWVEQEIAGQRYKAGWTEGVVIVRAAPPAAPPVTPPVHIPYKPSVTTYESWSRARPKPTLDDIIAMINGIRGKRNMGFKPSFDNLVSLLRKFRK